MAALEVFKGWWRPVGACLFVGAIFLRYIGRIDSGLTEPVELELLAIMKWFIGLYVSGRTAEKVATVIAPKLSNNAES